MRWSSAVSDSPVLADAVASCARKVNGDLGEGDTDLAIVFVSPEHQDEYDSVPGLMREHFGVRVLLGCSGQGVIGAGTEVEHRPGFSITVAELPDVEVVPFHVDGESLPDGDAGPEEWRRLVGTTAEEDPSFILLPDPFSAHADNLVEGLDYAFPDSVKIGGLASGAASYGENALFLNDTVYRSGAVGIALQGDITVETIVAQGCRPVGKPMQVTRASSNWLLELDGVNAFAALTGMFGELSERDRQLVHHSLFLGVVMDMLNDSPQHGDFLIRNIMGTDNGRGALAIGERLKEGQIVQFHLRDAETSAQDLDALLTRYAQNGETAEGAGALLFSCLGRGAGLYGRADHDTDMFRERVGEMPLAGFFCNGEIGQVSGSTFLHGYTSSFGIFKSK